MRITATRIDQWAGTPQAPGGIAVLVRRLIGATATLTELAVRGADTLNFPGWDGSISATTGNAWVPTGRSQWEFGCSEDVLTKARGDFRKRTDETPAEIARERDFVFVTPRIWRGKDAWREEATKQGHWRSVRAYDADDLEAWLEAAAGVALWFGQELGLQGPGVCGVQAFWDTWRNQTRPCISLEALSAGRATQVDQFADQFAKAPPILTLEADSSAEAAAFACAQLHALGWADRALCVTDVEGWRYADANPELRIAVAASPAVAAARAPREGFTLIAPSPMGDRASAAAKRGPAEGRPEISLARAEAQDFENALVELGVEPTDAARLTRSCGRSWSVYRRVRATNRAIARPAWMGHPAAQCLSAIVLIGAWNGRRAGDVACVQAVTGRRYEDVERDLLQLAAMDDAPVLKIGSTWKAKAPFELLYLFAPAITTDQLQRFFSTATAVLTKPDPALELENDKRWMASVYGQVREESGIVVDSIVDSLAKLRVYAEGTGDPAVMGGVDDLLRGLLENADASRWLSLAGVLQELAEASPEVFLRAVEASLRHPEVPIRALFAECGGDVVFGRNYHTDLLWALERLAWAPRHLGRVVDVLARLSAFPVPENLVNRPSNSLRSLLRPWWPQTTAGAKQRLDVLDRLIRTQEAVAWETLASFIPNGTGFSSANAKPRWRDDDAGAQGPGEFDGEYASELGARLLSLAKGRAERIATLVRHIDGFEGEYREQVLALLRSAVEFPDSQRQQVRDALRHHLNWHLSYNRDNDAAMAEAKELRVVFDELAPVERPTRHAWLFENGWVELPDGRDDDYREADKQRERLRAAALEEIFEADGWDGVERLIALAGTPGLVGWHVGMAPGLEAEAASWARDHFARHGHPHRDAVLRGVLYGMSAERRAAYLQSVRTTAATDELRALLSALAFERATWDFVETLPAELQAAYWRDVQPGVFLDEGADLNYAVDHLIAAGRPRTAFNTLQFRPAAVGSERLLAILEGIHTGTESEGGLLDGYRIAEALKALAEDESFQRRDLAVLEFRFMGALEHGRAAKTLKAQMSQDAEFFMELVCIGFPPKDGMADIEVHPSVRGEAWSLLHNGRGMPGLDEGGSVDREKFVAWVEQVRAIAQSKHRVEATDSILGGWLSKCPSDPDGLWPCTPVRELLEDPSAEIIRRGFHVGVLNNRGVHSRAMLAGGAPERTLAEHYHTAAKALQGSHPQTAAVLEGIARSYEHDAQYHDDDAAWMRES